MSTVETMVLFCVGGEIEVFQFLVGRKLKKHDLISKIKIERRKEK